YQQPDQHRGDGNTDVLGDQKIVAVEVSVKQVHAGGDADEFRDYVKEIDGDQKAHHQERGAKAILFTDEIAQSLAGNGAHAGTHLLHNDQRQGNGKKAPEESVSKLCSGERVGIDATGIIVDVRRDKARADYRKDQEDPGLPELQPFHWTRAARGLTP